MTALNNAKTGRKRGLVIAEAAASLVVLLPVSVLLLFAISEVSYCFMVKTCLADASRLAARSLAVDYGRDPAVANSRAQQEADVLDRIRIPNVVVSSDQFQVTFDTTSVMRTVHVDTTYKGGSFTLPLLPVPDPLGLGKDYAIGSDATYRLE